MFPNEVLLEITSFLNRDDLAHFIFTNRNICQLLSATKTVKFYQNNYQVVVEKSPLIISQTYCYCRETDIVISSPYYGTVKCYRDKTMMEKSMESLFIFKTIYYCLGNYVLKNKLLRIGSEGGHLEIVKLLVKDGADLTSYWNHSVCQASKNGHLEVVKFLVANGADLTVDENFAIRWASKNGHLEVVKFLVANGADLTDSENYAIRVASGGGHSEVVKFLVANGADLTARDNRSVHLASEGGHSEVVKFLIANGANLIVD